jgi:hypothetical protein
VPNISLLEPMVLRGVVEKFTAPYTLTMLSQTPQTPWPFPSVTWDIIKGSRMVAKPNVPNSEAHIVPRLGRSQAAASFVYLREKKVFEPTTLHWLRTPGQIAATNAEAAVLREVNDLNQRFDNFAEFLLWSAMKGQLAFDFPDVQANVDYQFPARPSAGTPPPRSRSSPTSAPGSGSCAATAASRPRTPTRPRSPWRTSSTASPATAPSRASCCRTG